MLYLNPPFHIVKGVSVFSDHADPLQFYYLPAMPHLTVLDGAPQVQLLQFIGGPRGGGFLNFTVDLGIGDELLGEVRAETKRLFNVEGQPRMAPAILEDGTVRLSALGKESGPPEGGPAGGAPPDPPPDPPPGDAVLPEFVLKINHPAKPALYGSNQAIFSVQLDEAGTALVKDSFEGVLMPIGVVYELEFLALRPAFNVRVHADWERVQTHFQERSETRVLFFSSEIDEIVDKLVEDQVIVIEVDNFIPEGEDEANVISDPKKVLDQVKDTIFDTFFEPTLNPISAAKSGWETASDVATKLSTLAVTGGWAGIATASYKKVDITRIDKKRFDFNLRERTTVRRRIYPQAHLQGLTGVLRDGGFTLDDFVRIVSIDDPWFRRRRVHVVNRANLETDDIETVKASLKYGSEHKSVTLDKATTDARLDWTSIVVNGAVVPDVEVGYTVNFANVDTVERPASLTAAPRTITDETFDVSPRADGLYHIVNVPVTALDFPWERYPRVQVDLRYADEANGISLGDTVLLDKNVTTTSWKWFVRDRAKDAFEYRVTYRAADHRDFSLDWRPTRDEHVLLRDPRPEKRTVTVVVAVSWSNVLQVFVDLTYRDDANGVRSEMSMDFSETKKEAQRFSVALEDPEQRVVHYDVKLVLTDGTLIEFPPSMTLQNQIIVRADLKGHRVVTVQPEPTDFKVRNVREVKAALHYVDAANSLENRSEFTMTSQDDLAFFEYDFVDPRARAYTLESRTIFNDGFVSRRDPQSLDLDTVAVKVG